MIENVICIDEILPGDTDTALIPSWIKSAAILLVNPITAAFVVEYAQRFGTPAFRG